MPYYNVDIRVTLKADSWDQAQSLPLDRICTGKDDPHEMWACGGEVKELTDDEAGRLLGFRVMLNQAMQDSKDGLYIEDPKHPGVRFSPGAAAQMAALEFEAGVPPEE